MKKTLFLILFTLVSILPVHADMGPKPNLTLHFEDMPENCYATVLATVREYGPNRPIDPNSVNSREEDYWEITNTPKEIYTLFMEETDKINATLPSPLYFWGVVKPCNEDYYWGYYPPEEFRILIYNAEKDVFILSEETYTRTDFATIYEVTLEDGALHAENRSTTFAILFNGLFKAFCRTILTIFIELIVLEFFVEKDNTIGKTVIKTNILTQGILNIVLFLYAHMYGMDYFSYMILLPILEAVIILIEGVVYKKKTDENILKQPFVYALVANLASCLPGIFLIRYSPSVFF